MRGFVVLSALLPFGVCEVKRWQVLPLRNLLRFLGWEMYSGGWVGLLWVHCFPEALGVGSLRIFFFVIAGCVPGGSFHALPSGWCRLRVGAFLLA